MPDPIPCGDVWLLLPREVLELGESIFKEVHKAGAVWVCSGWDIMAMKVMSERTAATTESVNTGPSAAGISATALAADPAQAELRRRPDRRRHWPPASAV